MQSVQFENNEATKKESILKFIMKSVVVLFLGGLLYSLYYFVYEKPQYTRRVQIVETSQPLHDYKIVQYIKYRRNYFVLIEWQGKTFEKVEVCPIDNELRNAPSVYSYLECFHYYYDKNQDEIFCEESIIDPSFYLYLFWGMLTYIVICSCIWKVLSC